MHFNYAYIIQHFKAFHLFGILLTPLEGYYLHFNDMKTEAHRGHEIYHTATNKSSFPCSCFSSSWDVETQERAIKVWIYMYMWRGERIGVGRRSSWEYFNKLNQVAT